MQAMRWVAMPLAHPPMNAENTTIMTSSEGGFGMWIPNESAISIALIVPAASSGPTTSARTRCHRPGPSMVDCGSWECWLLMPRARRVPSAPERAAPERYQIQPAAAAPLLTAYRDLPASQLTLRCAARLTDRGVTAILKRPHGDDV